SRCLVLYALGPACWNLPNRPSTFRWSSLVTLMASIAPLSDPERLWSRVRPISVNGLCPPSVKAIREVCAVATSARAGRSPGVAELVMPRPGEVTLTAPQQRFRETPPRALARRTIPPGTAPGDPGTLG